MQQTGGNVDYFDTGRYCLRWVMWEALFALPLPWYDGLKGAPIFIRAQDSHGELSTVPHPKPDVQR